VGWECIQSIGASREREPQEVRRKELLGRGEHSAICSAVGSRSNLLLGRCYRLRRDGAPRPLYHVAFYGLLFLEGQDRTDEGQRYLRRPSQQTLFLCFPANESGTTFNQSENLRELTKQNGISQEMLRQKDEQLEELRARNATLEREQLEKNAKLEEEVRRLQFQLVRSFAHDVSFSASLQKARAWFLLSSQLLPLPFTEHFS